MEELKDKLLKFLPDIISALVIVGAGILITFLIAKICKIAMRKSNLDKSLILFLIRLIWVTGGAVVIISALSKLGVSTTGLIAFFSAALAAVALALKDSISDVASGIIILFTRPFVTGDFIEFGEHKGFVQKIDIINTRILTYDDTTVVIPNSKITTEKINNYTDHPEMRVVIKVPIPYSADIDVVKELLTNTMLSHPAVLKDEAHAPSAKLTEYSDSSLSFDARCYCRFNDYWDVYFYLTENIKKALDKNDISIPFNQLDVHIIESAAKK